MNDVFAKQSTSTIYEGVPKWHSTSKGWNLIRLIQRALNFVSVMGLQGERSRLAPRHYQKVKLIKFKWQNGPVRHYGATPRQIRARRTLLRLFDKVSKSARPKNRETNPKCLHTGKGHWIVLKCTNGTVRIRCDAISTQMDISRLTPYTNAPIREANAVDGKLKVF